MSVRQLRIGIVVLAMAALATAAWANGSKESSQATAGSASNQKVTIGFSQWWQNEMDKGTFNAMVSKFEKSHPNITIKPITLPYADVRDQLFTQAAAGTLPDVAGVDPKWSFQLAKQGIVANLEPFFNATPGFKVSDYAALNKIDGKYLSLPVANYIYPLYYNKDMFKAAGLSGPPKTRADFLAYAKKLTNANENRYGWALPLDLKWAGGPQDDVWTWVWAAGGHVFQNGKPDLNTPEMLSALRFVKSLYDANVLLPGTLTETEQDMDSAFAAGQAAMIIDSLSHVTVYQRKDPNLHFGIAPIPRPAGYTGKNALVEAGWNVAIADSSPHKKQAWEFVNYLTSQSTDGFVAFHANGFPGNLTVKAESVVPPGPPVVHQLMGEAFDMYVKADIHAPLVGLPNALSITRAYDEELQKMLLGKVTPEELVKTVQAKWESIISNASGS